MKKKFRTILSLACLSVACTVAAACEAKTQLDVYRENGYTISVTYNANGGQFYGRSGVTIMDLFKPADFKKDEAGKVFAKCLEHAGVYKRDEKGIAAFEKFISTLA